MNNSIRSIECRSSFQNVKADTHYLCSRVVCIGLYTDTAAVLTPL